MDISMEVEQTMWLMLSLYVTWIFMQSSIHFHKMRFRVRLKMCSLNFIWIYVHMHMCVCLDIYVMTESHISDQPIVPVDACVCWKKKNELRQWPTIFNIIETVVTLICQKVTIWSDFVFVNSNCWVILVWQQNTALIANSLEGHIQWTLSRSD